MNTKKYIIFIIITAVIFASQCYAKSIYVSQSSVGDDSGNSCSNAHSAAWFNTAGSWGTDAGDITAGDSVYLCDNITTALTVLGNGSEGAVITIQFETGAKVKSATAFGTGGGIDCRNRSYIVVNGGSTCGYINRVDTQCNGLIANTGDPTTDIPLIDASGCTNCEFKNLEFYNSIRGIQNTTGTTHGATWTVNNNVFHAIGSAVVYVPGAVDDDGLIVYGNYFYNINSSVDISNNGDYQSGYMSAALIHDNHFSSTAIYDAEECPSHHNSLHAFAKPGTNNTYNSGIRYYNNYIDGDWGNCSTSLLFIEGGEYGANRNIHVYNNLFIPSNYDQMNNGLVGVNGDGALYVYNNTIIGLDVGGDHCFCTTATNDNASISFENNILVSCADIIVKSSYGDMAITAWDYNIYDNATQFYVENPTSNWYSFDQWKSYCAGCDVNSVWATTGVYADLNTNGSLKSSSPAINAGTNLSTYFTTDILGTPRGATWDIGAYEYIPTGPNSLKGGYK